jgi:hypothetical protein
MYADPTHDPRMQQLVPTNLHAEPILGGPISYVRPRARSTGASWCPSSWCRSCSTRCGGSRVGGCSRADETPLCPVPNGQA